MPLLEELPSAQQFSDVLSGLIGNEEDKTGLGGVSRLLTDIGADTLASSFTSQLNDTVSSIVSTDTSSLTEGVYGQFRQAIDSLPSSPDKLVAPLIERVEDIRNLTTTGLSVNLLESIEEFQNIQSLVPSDTQTLLSGAAEGLTQLRDQFISGDWGQLKQWSESVQRLNDELSPLFTDGSGSIEDRLVAYLNDKMNELVRIISPQQQGIAERVSGQLDQTISSIRVETIQTIKTDLINHINQAEIEFDNGNFTNTAHLSSAETGFQRLTDEISSIFSGLNQVLSSEGATAEGMTRGLQRQFDGFDEIEIIDLGNIRDVFASALKRAEEAVGGLNLEVVRENTEDVFNKVNEAIAQLDLTRTTDTLENLQNQIQSLLDGLDAALFEVVASIRNIFTQIKEVLRSIASTLGSYDEEGQFHFHIVREIEDFLNNIKTSLQETVQPMLGGFQDSVGRTLLQVQTILTSVQSEIESVKEELQSMLQGVSDRLANLDVTGKLEEVRQKFDDMLNGLSEIDFDPMVVPVVTQIDETTGELKKIDLSSLNDVLRNALRVTVQAVQQIDFSDDISDVLLEEIDKILELPKKGLNEIEENIEDALARLTEFDPSIILKPLDDLFDPVTAQLDALRLEKILEPLDEWHARIQEELDRLSPSVLLQPVIELHDQLKSSFQSISPEALIQPLQDTIDDLKTELQRLNITRIADDLGSALDSVNNSLDDISPEILFAPLVNGFESIVTAIDRFNPGDLLEPFENIFEPLMAPLDNLTEEHVRLIGEAFAGLRALVETYNPRNNFQTIQQKYIEVRGLIQQVNPGQIIADLRGPYNALKTSFETGGSADADISDRVNSLDPMRNETINQTASESQRLQSQLQNAFSDSEPSAELMSRYAEVRPGIESLAPTWVGDDMTAASIKEAFQRANPLNMVEEVNQLYETFKEQLQNSNPRVLQENVQVTYNSVRETFRSLDPNILVNGVQDVINNLNQRLDVIDLNLITDELDDLTDDVETIINGLDPRPVVVQLDDLTNEVKRIIDELKPSEALSELKEPFQAAKDSVDAFNPEFFKEPLIDIFVGIERVITEVDIGILLQPLDDRLNELRDELEDGLDRTGTAFNGMIAAIPV